MRLSMHQSLNQYQQDSIDCQQWHDVNAFMGTI
jgi:hypothetical protein